VNTKLEGYDITHLMQIIAMHEKEEPNCLCFDRSQNDLGLYEKVKYLHGKKIRVTPISYNQCPECERVLNPDATRCHNCNPYEEVN